MRALVPLNKVDHVDDYIAAGAGEFYIGFYDEKWVETFGEYADINRLTGFKKDANPYDLEQVKKIIRDIKAKGKLIYVTFNASVYSEKQLEFIRQYMIELKAVGVDGVIVSTLELVMLAKEVGVPSVASTIVGIYNADLARFYYEQGAKRIILPRDLSLDEIEDIVKAVPEPEYEVFMMRNGCRFSDAHCLGFHRSEMRSICSCVGSANSKILMKDKSFHNKHNMELNDRIYNQSFHVNACGLCSVYRFVKLGITAGKIVGRSDEWQYICDDIRSIKRNVELAKQCESEEEYLSKMEFPKDESNVCKLGLSCYYPEVRY